MVSARCVWPIWRLDVGSQFIRLRGKKFGGALIARQAAGVVHKFRGEVGLAVTIVSFGVYGRLATLMSHGRQSLWWVVMAFPTESCFHLEDETDNDERERTAQLSSRPGR